MQDKHALLQKYWGYGSFRPLQEEVVDSVLEGNDTLALMPTGGGKSLCYQLPALMLDGMCLVVSPLVALMKDQVQQLNSKHIQASCIVAGMSSQAVEVVINHCVNGKVKLLYVSPERLRQNAFIASLRQMPVSLIAVDEAHCISQWGYDFRPPYRQIADVRKYHPQAPVIALTATAPPTVVEDIQRQLQMRACRVFCTGFARPNLSYMVLQAENRLKRLLRIIHNSGGCGIVYVRSRRLTKEVADLLVAEGVAALSYHAGLDTRERDRRQGLWMEGKCSVMVATNAFGMGIDKPDVRFVVHLDLPDSIEAYYQEAGRAGRDGKPAYAVILNTRSSEERLLQGFDTAYPTLQYIRNVYRALCNFYRIPIGSGAGSRFDFAIDKVCANYNMEVRPFYNACRFLEREGLIAVPEREEIQSTLFIPISRNELYRFQVNHLQLGNLLQVVIRLYGGLFSEAVQIEEAQIARKCYIEKKEVKTMLMQLNDMHIVEYHPSSNSPQILFTTARIDEAGIMLNEQNYTLLKQHARERMEAMLAYVRNDSQCRSIQLQAYFGEKELHDCGICDVCRSRKKKPDTRAVEAAVLRHLEHNRYLMHELCALMENEGFEKIEDAVADLLDRGMVRMDSNLFLYKG